MQRFKDFNKLITFIEFKIGVFLEKKNLKTDTLLKDSNSTGSCTKVRFRRIVKAVK